MTRKCFPQFDSRLQVSFLAMAQQSAVSPPAAQSSHLQDAFVIAAMTTLALAFGAWARARFGVSLWAAMIAALAVYSALLAVHLGVRRSLVADDGKPGSRETARPRGPQQRPAKAQRPRHPFEADVEIAGAAGRMAAETLPVPRAGDPFTHRPRPVAPRHDTKIRSTEPPPLAWGAPEPETQQNPAAAGQVPPPEMSVEVIQDLIKKLADELNGAEAEDAASEAPEVAVGHAVEALDTTARSMQSALEGTSAHAPAVARGAPPPRPHYPVPPSWPVVDGRGRERAAPAAQMPPALNPELTRIAEAVAAERLEVLLEPIHALAEGKTCHFEVSVRLLTADGARLESSEFMRTARGSGLMPRIDAVRMVRAARVARRLGERGRNGAVLSQIAGESLADPRFRESAAGQSDPQGRMSLVLSFAQSEVRAFTAGHAEALRRLAEAGFGFALEEVTDLDMDFVGLRRVGFQFVKLDAQVFLQGLPAPGGRIPAADICRLLADAGLALIVGKIEDDWLLARILGFGVLLGKGTLFGGPKLVKAEVLGESGSVAA